MKKSSVIVLVTVVFLAVVLMASNYYWRRKYLKHYKIKVEKLTDSIKSLDAQSTKIIDSGKIYTTSTKKRAKKIDEKLKQDEEIIDNSHITNNELKRFLSKHGEDID